MRLIDADALRKAHCEDCAADVKADCEKDPICSALMWVDESPTIDAVPVVRCKDCKYRPKENGSLYGVIWVEFPEEEICPFNCEDPFYNQMPEDDFFCARGERRGDDA